MKILGIQLGHNSTVALLEDGLITAVLSQEKCDNIKNSSVFPEGAIRAVMDWRGLQPRDIDVIANAALFVHPQHCYESVKSAHHSTADPFKLLEFARKVERRFAGRVVPWAFSYMRAKRHQSLVGLGRRYLGQRLGEMGFSGTPIEYIEHHSCHARAAFHGMNRTTFPEPALIFTLDGAGDGLCATITVAGPDGSWKRIAETPATASLGYIYSYTTQFLGMKVLEHEYKVMGLAAYCKGYHLDTYERLLKQVITLDQADPLVFRSQVDTSTFYEYLKQHAVGERFDNLAGAVQHLLEERVIEWIRGAIHKTGIRRIFTSGGVFMNVKINKRVQELDEVEQVFFMPSCGDECNPIGAVYEAAVKRGIQVQPLSGVYLGLDYSDREIDAFIHAQGLSHRYHVKKSDDMEETIANLLADRHIVARFSGRCEWGARSLGNRAILAHPSHLESFYTVNDLIKARDFWMPFAPTVLDTAAYRYLEGYNPKKVEAPYMITAFTATALGVQHLRAAMHQGDHTIRPQVLLENANPAYYRLLQAFERRTGVGAVLNTSLNLHGYPLAATPEQALMTFEKSGLQHLALGNVLISKR